MSRTSISNGQSSASIAPSTHASTHPRPHLWRSIARPPNVSYKMRTWRLPVQHREYIGVEHTRQSWTGYGQCCDGLIDHSSTIGMLRHPVCLASSAASSCWSWQFGVEPPLSRARIRILPNQKPTHCWWSRFPYSYHTRCTSITTLIARPSE